MTLPAWIPAWLLPAAFAMHGLGMAGGVYFVFGTEGWLARAAGGALMPVRVIVAVVWLAAGLACLAAAWGLFKDLTWWRTAAYVGGIATIVGAVAWAGKGIPFGVWIGAAFCIAVMTAMVLGW